MFLRDEEMDLRIGFQAPGLLVLVIVALLLSRGN
jgi:hypothetical protein